MVDGPAGATPAPRFVHAACGDGEGNLWIFGGLTFDHADLGDLWCYSPSANRWRKVESPGGDVPGPRYGARMACCDGRLYLFGGNVTGVGRLGDFYRFDPEADTWQRLTRSSGDVPGPRYAHALIAVDDGLYLFGGGGAGYLNDLYRYRPAADRWERLDPEGEIPGPRGFVAPVCPDGKGIYLFGGWQPADSYGAPVNADLYRYDIEKNRFTLLSTSPKWGE
ncbi:MAG: Kelch repeat-containing protein [Planctomycetota bacterium]